MHRLRRIAAGLGLIGLLSVAPRDASAQAGQGIRFGLAHVDLMELHLERQDGGPPLLQEQLPPAELARRYALASATGAVWQRWSIYRELVESPSGLDWTVVDGIAERDARAGLRSLVVLQGPSEGMQAPIFLDSAGHGVDDPERAVGPNPANGWASFVDAAAERYAPGGRLATSRAWPAGAGVGAWEIGNEPNLRAFWPGSPADYLRYLEVAYLVIHRRDPSAIVLHGGIGDDGNAEDWYRRFLDALLARAADSPLPARHGHYFDRAAWHWYRTPAFLMTGPARARALIEAAGLPAKPIWVTETGLPVWSEHPGPCWDPDSPGRATTVEQAGFVWQTLAEAAASQVEVVVLFQLVDDCGNGPTSYDAFGLVRNPLGAQCWQPPEAQPCWRADPTTAGTPRPAYAAFQAIARQLTGATPQGAALGEAGRWRGLVFDRQPDTRLTVAWSTRFEPQTIEMPALGDSAEILTIEPDGSPSRQVLRARDGRYRLALPGASNRNAIGGRGIVDGRPLILVERPIALVQAPDPAGEAIDTADDHEPPLLAVVEALPERSPLRFDLSIAAADPGSGLAAWRLFVASGPNPPDTPAAWREAIAEGPWSVAAAGGRLRLPFEGRPGRRYYFAAQAGDRAGNWTALPAYAQASTRLVQAGRGGLGGRAGGHLPH